MSNENGPDRELGLWFTANSVRCAYAVDGGVLVVSDQFRRPASCIGPFVVTMLKGGGYPLDTTAEREAIRAGWREVDGRWTKDEREGQAAYRCKCSFSHPNSDADPDCWEATARAMGEWPADEPATRPLEVKEHGATIIKTDDPSPEPGPSAPKLVVSRDAERAMAAIWREAYDQGRRDEQRAQMQMAKPCVLKRLMDGTERTCPVANPHEAALLIMLGAVLAEAKKAKVDLSDLAERMASGVPF